MYPIWKINKAWKFLDEMSNLGRRCLTTALFLLLFTTSISNSSELHEQKQSNKNLKKYRLPKSLEPTFYDIKYHKIDLEKSHFSGNITINVIVKEITKSVVLHCGRFLNCNFTQIYIYEPDLLKVDFFNLERNDATEKVSVTLKKPLQKDSKIKITLDYKGQIQSGTRSLYKSSYLDDKNEEK